MTITIDTPLNDLINMPAFASCKQILLPPFNALDALKVRDVYRLLPYHSNIHPKDVAMCLNDMQDRFQAGSIQFHPIYTDLEIQKNPRKKDVGIYHFKVDVHAKFGMICPGGGFQYVGSIHEGFPFAIELNNAGYAAFVLHYRVGSQLNAVEDLATALTWIHDHAIELDIDSNDYSLWGGSAGARMIALVDSYGTAYFGGKETSKAAAVIMAYTGHEDVSGYEAPTYVIVGDDDWIAPPRLMKKRVDALKTQGTALVFKIVLGVAHGFGLGNHTKAEGWIHEAITFWKKHTQK